MPDYGKVSQKPIDSVPINGFIPQRIELHKSPFNPATLGCFAAACIGVAATVVLVAQFVGK